MKCASILAAAAAAAFASIPAQAQTPALTVTVVGQVLAVGNGYLAFTTGEAVLLGPRLAVPATLSPGTFVRLTFDPVTHAAIALELRPKALAPGDLDAAHLPRAYVSGSPGSRRIGPPLLGAEAGAELGRIVAVTIDVRVPDNTPANDDIYLATDRTNYGPAEIRMLRIDARTWSAAMKVPAGTVLHYEFTRGSFPTIERDRLGGLIVPRALIARADRTYHDAVARWADI
ncbi:MAG: hypothetical protein GIW95_06540 [Candidatus Eremiobacteraeota bacterium]|nr:hypothetical protein [Candidatus Eremiobacteraeota bacterium]